MSLLDTLKDSNGQYSSTRFTMILIIFVILAVFLGHNIYSMLNDHAFVDFPVNVVVILGIVLTGKVSQKIVENASKNKE